MNNPLRQFWFRHYWWITVVVLGAAIAAVLISRTDNALSLVATLVGVGLTVIYFVQKQKLEELQMFEKLFTQFNQRYQELNDRLEDVLANEKLPELEVRKTLNAYLNLCAEEYLFYSEGRIHPAVWKAWCRGMLVYLKNERIRRWWDAEVKAGSYYGLTVEAIEEAAL
jgi:hypothetical protein